MHVFSQASGLQDIADIEDIPKAYGGQLDWEYGDNPNLDDEAKAVLGGEYPLGAWEFDEATKGKVKPRGDGKRMKAGGVVANGDVPYGEEAGGVDGTGETALPAVNGNAHGVAAHVGDAPVPGPAQPKTVLVAPTDHSAASTPPAPEHAAAETTDTNAVLTSRVP